MIPTLVLTILLAVAVGLAAVVDWLDDELEARGETDAPRWRPPGA